MQLHIFETVKPSSAHLQFDLTARSHDEPVVCFTYCVTCLLTDMNPHCCQNKTPHIQFLKLCYNWHIDNYNHLCIRQDYLTHCHEWQGALRHLAPLLWSERPLDVRLQVIFRYKANPRATGSHSYRCNGPRVVPCRKSAEVCILRIAHARANAVDAMQPAWATWPQVTRSTLTPCQEYADLARLMQIQLTHMTPTMLTLSCQRARHSRPF